MREEWNIGVGTFYVSEKIQERIGGGFPFCAFRVAVEEMLGDGCGYAGVLKDSGVCAGFGAGNDCSPLDVG